MLHVCQIGKDFYRFFLLLFLHVFFWSCSALNSWGHCIELDYIRKVFLLSYILRPKHKNKARTDGLIEKDILKIL